MLSKLKALAAAAAVATTFAFAPVPDAFCRKFDVLGSTWEAYVQVQNYPINVSAVRLLVYEPSTGYDASGFIGVASSSAQHVTFDAFGKTHLAQPDGGVTGSNNWGIIGAGNCDAVYYAVL